MAGRDPLLEFASKRAYDLNLSSAWGTNPDGTLINLLLGRIKKLQEIIDEKRSKGKEHGADKA